MKLTVSIPDKSDTRRTALERSMYAMAFGQASPIGEDHAQIAARLYPNDRLVQAIVERGDASIAATGTAGFGAEVAQNLVADFLATLAPLSAASAIMARALSIPMGAAATMSIPAREGGPSTTVAWVGEGDPIPVRSYALNDDASLQPKKIGLIVAISRELARRANGEAVVRQLLREDVSATLDAAVFSADAASASGHAGMLDGVAAITSYTGGDREALEADLIALGNAVAPGGSGEMVYVVSPARANRLKVKAPDIAREMTILPSLGVAADAMIAVDPQSWAFGFGDNFEIDVSETATLHMSDDPLPIVAGTPTTADPVRSLYQTATIALRLLVDVAFTARRPNAVAWISGATW